MFESFGLPTLLPILKQQIELAYGGQRPWEEISANRKPSWAIKELSPGHSILLHNESVENSKQIRDENHLILIEEMLFQFEISKQKLVAFECRIADLTAAFASIQHRFAENVKKLVTADAIAAIHLILVENCIKEIEQLLSHLDTELKAVNTFINSHQKAINICCALFFPPSFKTTDSTLQQELPSINEMENKFKDDISKFKEELAKNQNLLMQSKPDSPVLNRIAPEYADIQDVIAGLYEIEIFNPMDNKVKLHQVTNLDEYVKNIILALRNLEVSDLFDPLINYRQERLNAIRSLIDQLALSLALGEPPEKKYILYRWIEICRGKSPAERFFNKELFNSKLLTTIHQDPSLNEIYFKLPQILQADLSVEAELRAHKTNVIDSTRSIDDPNLNMDQISRQWCRFISQERGRFKRGSRPNSLELMYNLYENILNAQERTSEEIALWRQQLRIAYKIYETEQEITSENRLVTKEPLTEEEYQFIQNDTSLSKIFGKLSPEVKEKLRLEHYKSILLQVLAKHSSPETVPINSCGLLRHDERYSSDELLTKGQLEFSRGFRFLIEGEFLQYKLKHDAIEKLTGILKVKGFTQDEALSVIAFMREQIIYSIFSYFFSARGRDVKGYLYNIKELPQSVNIYKEDGMIYFEVKSSPWCLIRTDLENPIIFPEQSNENQIDKFYDAEFRLRYELIRGQSIEKDVLRLLDVTTDTPASWQLLNFQSEEWKKLPEIKRYIKNIDLTMVELNDAKLENQQKGKNTIDKWLSDEPNSFSLDDYKLIQNHLLSIEKVENLSMAIGKEWLKANLSRCALKIELYNQKQSAWDSKKSAPLYVAKPGDMAFDPHMVCHDLISKHPERIAQAQHEIVKFLSLSPSLIQCEILHGLLCSLLTSSLQIEPDWLETQIKLCKTHIEDAFIVSKTTTQLINEEARLDVTCPVF